MLSHMKRPVQEIREAIIQLDEAVLNGERLPALIRFAPTPDEVRCGVGGMLGCAVCGRGQPCRQCFFLSSQSSSPSRSVTIVLSACSLLTGSILLLVVTQIELVTSFDGDVATLAKAESYFRAVRGTAMRFGLSRPVSTTSLRHSQASG